MIGSFPFLSITLEVVLLGTAALGLLLAPLTGLAKRTPFPAPTLTASVVLTLALAAFLLVASCAAPPDLDEAIPSESAPVGTPESASNLTPTATPASTLAPMPTPTPTLSPTPSPTAMADSVAHMTFRPARLTPDSVDQYIFRADIIVRASFLSAAAGVEGAGAAFLPVNNLRFRAVEYLKGTDAAEFTVAVAPLAYPGDTHSTRHEAQRIAEEQLAARNITWDNREGILFLTRGTWSASGTSESSGEPLRFARRGVSASMWDYSIDKLERVWLPNASALGVGGQSDAGRSYLTSVGGGQAGGAVGTTGASAISLADLRSKIAAMDALLEKGEGVDGYQDCIATRLAYGTYQREQLARTGTAWTFPTFEVSIPSGASSGESFLGYSQEMTHAESLVYSRFRVDGPDRAYFSVGVLDDDQDPKNGWRIYQVTTRPLPANLYEITVHTHSHFHIPCNFNPGVHHFERVTVTAPPGTVHEAFFDPVVIGSAIGADGANGALKPTSFTANETATVMQSLQWDPTGIVTLTLNPNASLSGLALDFIALDGTISLTLPASAAKTDSAAGTLRWSMLNSPWQAGDKLMLRIRNATSSPIPTAAPTPTPDAPSPTPTDTPTPVPTSTPTPTALPDAPPGVVSGQ